MKKKNPHPWSTGWSQPETGPGSHWRSVRNAVHVADETVKIVKSAIPSDRTQGGKIFIYCSEDGTLDSALVDMISSCIEAHYGKHNKILMKPTSEGVAFVWGGQDDTKE